MITGASQGIGRACAEYLHARGERVYGTSRDWSARPPAPFEMIPMDAARAGSVEEAVQTVLAREGRLDALVNNAGMGIAGAVEDTSLDEARAQMEANFFSVVRACRAALPSMRERRSGIVVNISSLAGLIAVPFQSLYSASKFAVEGFSEALRMEVRPYGIRVVLIEPGDFHTPFTANRRRTAASAVNPAYRQRFERALAVMERDETHGPDPARIARLLARILDSPRPRLRYRVGPLPERLAAAARPLVPPALFEWALVKYYGL